MKSFGKFFGIGLGSGNHDDISLKGLNILKKVHVICAPKSHKNRRSIALTKLKNIIDKEFEFIQPIFPMTKDQEVLREHWKIAGELIMEKLSSGKDVAFITIGDPLFYSTYSYVMKLINDIEPGIEIETISGGISPLGCLAHLNIPLIEGEDRLAVIPAFYGLEDLKKIAGIFDTIVLMKVSRNFPRILNEIKEMGMMDDSIFLSNCGTQEFIYRPLLEMEGKDAGFLSMIIIKKNIKKWLK